MLIRAILLSAIVAAAAGCRDRDATDRDDVSYSRPIESTSFPVESTTTVPTGTGMDPKLPEGWSMGLGTPWSGIQPGALIPAPPTPANTEPEDLEPNAQITQPDIPLAPDQPEVDATSNEAARANATSIRSRTVTPPRNRATTPRDANDTTRAGTNTGTSTTPTSGSIPPTTDSDDAADESPSSGTSAGDPHR